MSKRLQVLLPEREYQAYASIAKKQKMTLSDLVRKGLKEVSSKRAEISKEERISRLLELASHAGPTGDIDQILKEIEAGRGLYKA